MNSSTSRDRSGAHVALIGNQLASLVRFRGPLIRDLVAAGARVTAVCPDGEAAERRELAALGAALVPVRHLSRAGLNPLADLRYLSELTGILRRIRPTCQFAFFLKPVVWGALAGVLARTPWRVGMVEGLGYAFAGAAGANNLRRRLARVLAALALRGAHLHTHRLVVLNADDAAMFGGRVERLDGIGVDLDHFAAAPPATDPVTFTLAARLIREKGVDTFVEAARLVRRDHPETRFLLLGALDDNPSAISAEEVAAWVAEGAIDWPGHVADIRPSLAETSVFVLPSRYREGLPRSIMEAMAMGRPVITSSAPGCREAVTEGVSGRIVRPGDPVALARAMAGFLAAPGKIAEMGAAARAEAVRRYDVRRANARLIEILLD